jgi:hypothetical protein
MTPPGRQQCRKGARAEQAGTKRSGGGTEADEKQGMLKELQIHRQILYDLVVHYLEPLSAYGRLAYLASLRDPATGNYTHERLAAVYGEQPVAEVLSNCHEEVFERLLEMPLAQQEEDLQNYVNSLPSGKEWDHTRCEETARGWIPSQAPDYLRELFCSNTSALCELLHNNSPNR